MAKEFETIDELIDLLESRNVITDENTKTQLMRESYYAVVNGYKKPFLDTQAMKGSADDIFLKGTRFEWIYSLFLFDRDLRSLTFKYIAKAEAIMKNAVVYSFCKTNPGPNDYFATSSYASAKEMLFAKGFSGNRAKIHQTNLSRLMSVLNKKVAGSDGKAFISHYVNRYGFVPLWVLANDLTFGHIAHFYQLQRRSVQNSTCKTIVSVSGSNKKITPQELLHAFSVLVDFRNLCAHDERLYCAKTGRSHDIAFKDMVERMVPILPQEELFDFFNELSQLFDTYKMVMRIVNPNSMLKEMGIPTVESLTAEQER